VFSCPYNDYKSVGVHVVNTAYSNADFENYVDGRLSQINYFFKFIKATDFTSTELQCVNEALRFYMANHGPLKRGVIYDVQPSPGIKVFYIWLTSDTRYIMYVLRNVE
jgi:hypothetical protein